MTSTETFSTHEYRNRIYLIGYMGCGKSTIGKKLAHKLSMSFVDTDTLFEERHKISIHSFFKTYQEKVFRNFEREILYQTTELENTIIATGGGMPCFFENMDFINRSGFSIYLKTNTGILLNRIRKSKTKRPLMEMPYEKQLAFIEAQLLEREYFYKKAMLTVEVGNLDMECLKNEIIKRYVASV